MTSLKQHIHNTSISGVKSSWTTLDGDRLAVAKDDAQRLVRRVFVIVDRHGTLLHVVLLLVADLGLGLVGPKAANFGREADFAAAALTAARTTGGDHSHYCGLKTPTRFPHAASLVHNYVINVRERLHISTKPFLKQPLHCEICSRNSVQICCFVYGRHWNWCLLF